MSSPKSSLRHKILIAALIAVPLTAAAILPPWMQHVRADATFEAALYRMMDLPGVQVFFPRPPKESVAELNKLPESTALYSIRARQEEQSLDFTAAENDWKAFAASSPDHTGALLDLAAFYERRLEVKPQFATLLEVANSPNAANEAFTPIAQQRSWRALESALALSSAQSFDDPTVLALWRAWISRYPQQPTVYARAFTWALDRQRFPDAEAILARYKAAFPADQVFPIKATALLALKQGGPDAQQKALNVYDAAFQPLWPDALVGSYFSLLSDTHNLRHFIADANARLQRNPDDLDALGRIFLYDQHQSQGSAALAALDQYRRSKDARRAPWSAVELDTLARLALAAQDAPDAARYDFALYSMTGTLPGGRDAKETGLSNMISLLLSTPDQPITLGAGNLSMYRDIATLDRGPGYWNGILSLWFNSTSPNNEFAEEEKKAQPYFQRAKAAELLALLDREAPSAPQRAALHAQLLHAYADYGDNGAVIHEGSTILAQFPDTDSTFRLGVAMTMADAYARENDTTAEFALYDRTLAELGARAKNMPLSAASPSPVRTPPPTPPDADDSDAKPQAKAPEAAPAFQLDTGSPAALPHPDADAYAQVLDRYLGRLTSTQQLPQALAVLRKELDRNPNDPLLYEKLANFLDQNKLYAQQEEIYRQALEKFPGASWTDKLARLYLRQKRTQDYAALTRKVTDTFDGTDVDTYFRQGIGGGAQLYLQLNLYAHQRFPHDIVFTQNLLNAYNAKPTFDHAAHEKLLRETWWQTPELTRQFFEYLSSTGKLETELAQLQPSTSNPAAQQEAAEVQLWRSHFEESAPLFADLSAAYPADAAIGTTASDLQRSLAWFDPSHIANSVAIEQRLLSANPGDLDRLARIGDILADHADDSAASLAPAAQYWRRMPAVAPGNVDGYLQSATIFWDYFQFDDALAEIAAARAHFRRPTLFGYEAGAVAEGKRDYSLAIREYLAAALEDQAQQGEAAARLLQLARRPSTRDLADSATAAAAKSGDASALKLRLTVLNTLHRESEGTQLLANALKAAKTASDIAAIADLARAHSLNTIYDEAITREADLTTDPVERLQLLYTLARDYEDRNDIPAASRIIDAIYHDNPVILGVVRSTVDFDWRSKRQPQAITVLVAAAHASQTAQPNLARQFTAEAAAKANESGDTRQARGLAESLLQSEPYNAEYLALAADSYARANDNAGLKQFYLARLDTLKTAAMSNDDRKARTALLRKGLIPALTRAHDYEGAVDQYIALLSAYPEDSDLTNEAALYALRNNRKQQLIDFFETTTKSSPRDSRFFIDLAQTQTVFGDLPSAIDSYSHAIAIRKDRADLYTAKAALEETLQRFDEAAADYQRLYVLSYKDPQWQVAIARVRARQGRAGDAADALKIAFLTGPRHVPHDYFQIAAQLEQWNFLDASATFAEQGRAAAGDRFLTADASQLTSEDVATYARILTRQRRASEALKALRAALSASAVSSSSPSVIAAQVQSQGVGSVTDAEWRKQQAAARKLQAEAAFRNALIAIGDAVNTYYTPEERSAYSDIFDRQLTGATPRDIAGTWIPAAHAAGLLDKEATLRKQLLLAPGKDADAQVEPYIQLQSSRLLFAQLGQTLEAFLNGRRNVQDIALAPAADAYHSAGDAASEIRVLRLRSHDDADSQLRVRYLDLLLHHDTAALLALAASSGDSMADAAANLALTEGTPALAYAAINARGKALPTVWTPATTGLASLFYADTTGKGDAAFRTVLLPDATIAERLANKPDTSRQLTGELWFYYAARDGQLRLLAPATQTTAEDLLAADLEYAPDADNYKALAQTYVEAGNTTAALTELDHVLESDPNSADTQDARGIIFWDAGRKDEAIAAWRAALASLRVIEDRASAPETFWSGFAHIASHLHERGIAAQFKPQMDDVLRIYIKRNGNYRSNELLKAAFTAVPDADWIISLASAAVDPLTVLQSIDHAAWLPGAARETILLEEIQRARAAITPASTNSYDFHRQIMLSAQDSLVNLYAAQGQYTRALALFRTYNAQLMDLNGQRLREVVLAAHTGELDSVLANYRAEADTEYTASDLREAAKELAADGRWKEARAVLEFTFDRAVSVHNATPTDYLALAEARLHSGDLEGAVTLLDALVQLPGDTYANLDSAASLLEETSHPAAAVPFLTAVAHSVPWDLSYALRLAEAQQVAGQPQAQAMAAIARNPLATYALRTRAATDLSGTGSTKLGSTELTLLATKAIPPTEARQPFFVAARVAAAAQTKDVKQQAALLHEAAALTPGSPEILLDVFHAELRINDAAGTRAALDALLKTPSSADHEPTSSILTDPSEREEDPTIGGEYYAPQPAMAAAWPALRRAKLALEFAEVYRRDGDDHPAIAYFKLFLHFAPTGPSAADVRAKIAAIEAAERLDAANHARRPVIHKTLDQAIVVRQRLTVAPDGAPSTPKEEE